MGGSQEVKLDSAAITELVLGAQDRLHSRLLEVGKLCTADDPNWRSELLRMFSIYAKEIGFDLDVTFPIRKLLHELAEEQLKATGKIANNEMSVNRSMALNIGVAILDILVKRKVYSSVKEAEICVSNAIGIEGRILRDHRNGLSRGMRPHHVKEGYEQARTAMSTWSTDDLLSRAAALRSFV